MSYEYPQSNLPPAVPNSTMAVVSLVCGILGLTFLPLVGSIVALVTGYMAKKEIQNSAGALGGDGLATAGIVLGWISVGLGVIGLCIGGILLAIPLCAGIGLWSSEYNWIMPVILGLI